MGAAILDRKSWGPPSLTGSDVKSAKVGPILLSVFIVGNDCLRCANAYDDKLGVFHANQISMCLDPHLN